MMTTAEKVALVETLAGALTEAQKELLPGLCLGAEAGLREQLRPGARGYEEVLDYAAVLTVAGWMQAGLPEAFTAGDFSVRQKGSGLETMALGLLRPWLAEGFAFCGV